MLMATIGTMAVVSAGRPYVASLVEGSREMNNLTRRNFIEGLGAAGMLGILAGCGNGGTTDGGSASDTPLVVGYSPFSS